MTQSVSVVLVIDEVVTKFFYRASAYIPFQVRRSLRLGVHGRLVVRIVEVAPKQKPGHAIHIATLLNRPLKHYPKPVMKKPVRYLRAIRKLRAILE